MQGKDLEIIKEVPGYKAILKAVLKSQIQVLVMDFLVCVHLLYLAQLSVLSLSYEIFEMYTNANCVLEEFHFITCVQNHLLGIWTAERI